jgi:hypothetical protein
MKKIVNHIVFVVKDATLFCKKATFLMEKSYTQPLSYREKIQLKIHLSICKNCFKYEQQSRLIEQVLKNKILKFNLSDTTKIRFHKVIEENFKNI